MSPDHSYAFRGPGSTLAEGRCRVCAAAGQETRIRGIIDFGMYDSSSYISIPPARYSEATFLACCGGRGKVFQGDNWQTCKRGMAYLLPAETTYGLKSIPGTRWEFCWVSYTSSVAEGHVARAELPVTGSFDAFPLQSAVAGLTHECRHHGQPDVIRKWIRLVDDYVSRFSIPRDGTDSLHLLWTRVAAHIEQHWSLARLKRESGYSAEHLRRLCHLQFGRSPMQQVTFIRMQRAAELMAATNHTIEAIAQMVGYHNPFVFSNAFVKWIGLRPSEYRRRLVASQGSLQAA